MNYRRIGLVVGLIVGVLAVEWVWLKAKGRSPVSAPTPPIEARAILPGGPFSLVDHAGNPVTEQDYRGRPVVMVFGYTFCPDVCPTTLQHVANALDLLEERAGQVQPLFVTIDPERDSPEVLADYVGAFHPRLVGLTGTEEQIAEIAMNYRVYRAKADMGDGDYLMDHSAFIYLLGPDGRLMSYLRHDAAPEAIAGAIEPLLVRDTRIGALR